MSLGDGLMEPQKEIEEGEGAAYDMEKRLLALKNAYAENVDQKRDAGHGFGGGIVSMLAERKKISVSAEDRYHLIAIEAYYRAKRQNFDPRYVVQQWIEAQVEVDRMLEGNELQETKPHHDATLHGHE
jgi:hypothetical protein